jgi:hypothetical protein
MVEAHVKHVLKVIVLAYILIRGKVQRGTSRGDAEPTDQNHYPDTY